MPKEEIASLTQRSTTLVLSNARRIKSVNATGRYKQKGEKKREGHRKSLEKKVLS